MPIPSDSIQIDFTGRIHNLADLRNRLEMAENDTDAIVRAGWQRWRDALAEHLIGNYALAIRDDARRLIYLARDPLGTKPLYYRLDQGRLAYGYSIPELKQQATGSWTKDLDWAAAYMLHLSFSQTETAYKEVKKLAPGHWLTCDAEGRIKTQRYHQWRDDAPFASKRDPRWVEAYREILEESIRCRIDQDAPIGTENSGGIDSATITAYLAYFLGEPGDRLHSFAFALCEQEPAFILETSQARRIRHNYVITNRYGPTDQSARVAQSLAVLGYPEEHGNASGHIPFYEECQRRSIRTLHSGFGGDEAVTNHGSHTRWELLDRRQYAALWDVLPGDPIRRTLRLFKALTVGHRKASHNPSFLHAWNQRWPHQLLRPDVVQRLNLYERYMETAIYDAPYRRTNDFILQHHLARMQVAARLENCTVMAAAYGVDYQWPLWDQRLVQQYLSTPSIEKLGPKGLGRYLHRRAIDGVVPKRVAWKPSKDMGYARLQQEMNHEGIVATAKFSESLAANLHPALEALIDLGRFHQQIAQAKAGGVNMAFGFSFRRSSDAIAQLDGWLKEIGLLA